METFRAPVGGDGGGGAMRGYVSVLGLSLGIIFPQSLCSVRGVRKVVAVVHGTEQEQVG